MATQAELDQTLARLEGLGYGKPMRELFMQDPDYVQMNHGSVSLRCHHSAKGQSTWRRALTRQEICATADANDARVVCSTAPSPAPCLRHIKPWPRARTSTMTCGTAK